jgi:beta-lactamase superfamily II metal-dependent hydrolase
MINGVIAQSPGELYSETNDNSVAILLTYATARVLLAGDAEAREEGAAQRFVHGALSGG